MPPNPTAPTSRVSQTWGRRKALSSRRPVAAGSPGQAGTKNRISSMVTATMPVTLQYAERQPRCWPRYVAAGTPTMFAIASPSITMLTARPRRSGVASEAATSEATPK
jgi:hypothetical protein